MLAFKAPALVKISSITLSSQIGAGSPEYFAAPPWI
jgi:hypothetical protein